jgi:hypothetical protein
MEDASTAVDQQPEQEFLIDKTVRSSPQLGQLAAALAKAQLEFTPVVKGAENPAYKRGFKAAKYADLASVIDATRPALAKNGLVVIQMPRVNHAAKMLTMTTKLLHSSGEWIENDLTVPATQQGNRYDIQSIGSAMTYTRRYAWQAIVGVTAEEDDDGNAAAGVGSREAQQEVAAEKIQARETRGSKAIPCLYYIWHDESQTAEITGADEIKTANKDVLKPLYNAASKTIVANAEQLEALKYEFEKRNVLFRPLQENRA